MTKLESPYWAMQTGLPGLDFNRQVVEPGTSDVVPEGGLAIYVDSDYWCAALLPADPYLSMPLPEIVAELWPTYAPDHGSDEQREYFARLEDEHRAALAADLEEEVERLREENARLKAGRTDVMPRTLTGLEVASGYFTREYEHLLVATAHAAQPRTDMPGICSVCGLLGTDRIHEDEWIQRHADGYRPAADWPGHHGSDRHG